LKQFKVTLHRASGHLPTLSQTLSLTGEECDRRFASVSCERQVAIQNADWFISMQYYWLCDEHHDRCLWTLVLVYFAHRMGSVWWSMS